MKILFLNAYYKPDKTASLHLGDDLREAMAEAGHSIELYAPTPTRGVSEEVRRQYKKELKDTVELDGALKVHRFSLFREGRNSLGRAVRYVFLELSLLWFALRSKGVDMIPMGSTPPINGLVAVLIKKWKKIPYVYTIQDLFPESLVSTGMTKKGSLLWKLGNWITGTTCQNAAHIMVISESMKKALVEKGVPEDKITVSYNWIDTQATRPIPKEENPLFEELFLNRDDFSLVYAGNLGNSQNVSILVDCAKLLEQYSDIRFVIFGSGTEKEKLQKKIEESGLSNIQLFPLQPMERVSQVYSIGDACFVTGKRGVGVGAFPSKAASIMATATPIIASFDEDSDLCRMIRQENIGLCAPAEDAQAAAEAVLKLYRDREACKVMGENARKLACSRLSKEAGTALRVGIYEKYAGKDSK